MVVLSFFERLNDDERGALFAAGARTKRPRGTILFAEGDSSDRVVVLLGGRVKVACSSMDGHETVLAIRGEGDVLGELSALDGLPRSATATALEPVEILAVPVARFRRFLESHPRASFVLLQALSRRLRDADRKRLEFGAFDATVRVAARLVELAERYGRDADGVVHLRLPISQQELASWIGASREAVSKALGVLRRRGWIETSRLAVLVRDLEALRTFVG